MANRTININDKIKLPKSIYKYKYNKFSVSFYSKKYKKNFHVGYYNSIEEAVKERDKFIIENIDDKLEGYMPRGLTKMNKYYKADFHFKGEREYMGTFDTMQEAISARNKYIDSLK